MRPSFPLRIVLAASLLALSVSMSGCNTALPAPATLQGENDIAHFYLEAGSDTSAPFLSLSPDAGPVTRFRPPEFATNPASAAQRMASAAAPASVTFRMAEPLTQDYYLNVSKSISGTVFLATGGSDASGHENTVYRIEFFADDKRVFGMQNMTDLATGYTGWLPIGINQRSETHLLSKGSTLSVKVTRVAGLTDLSIGTGGATQSMISVAFFRTNPLSGALYVEKGTLLVGPGAPTGVEAIEANLDRVGDGPGPHFVDATIRGSRAVDVVFTGLSLVALGACLPRPPRRRALTLLLLACVVGPVFAGCMGGAKPIPGGVPDQMEPTLTSSTADYQIVDREGLNESSGAIEGRVQDRIGLPITDAHISLLGTIHTARPDADGRFGFTNLTQGSFMMRVDADRYLPVEQKIEVLAGRLTQTNVTLVRIVKGTDIHSHDYWGDETKRTVMEKTVPMQGYTVPNVGDRNICPGAIRCEKLVMLDEGQSILPGTTLVEVVLTGTAPATGPQEFEVRVITAGNLTPTQRFGPRKLGEPFHIAIYPNEADPGHQRVSRWQFFVAQFSQSHLFDALAPPVTTATNLQMTVHIHKGVVPYEPVHQDFWQGRTEVGVVSARTISVTHTSLDYPADEVSWTPDKGAFVPPGTIELRGSLSWTHPQSAPAGSTWALAYRAADMPPAATWRKPDAPAPATNRFDFVIHPKPEEPDQFYQAVSYWRFSPDDQQAPLPGIGWGSNTGYSTKFTLTVTAIRDPKWVETAV